MIDQWINDIEEVRRDGAVVLIKFDGERKSRVYTFAIIRIATDFTFRCDTDDLEKVIPQALLEYWQAHPPSEPS